MNDLCLLKVLSNIYFILKKKLEFLIKKKFHLFKSLWISQFMKKMHFLAKDRNKIEFE